LWFGGWGSNPLYFYAEGSKRQNPLGILSVYPRTRLFSMHIQINKY